MRTTPVRVTSFVGGVLINAWMYLLVSKSAVGSGPLFVFEEGLSAFTGMPFSIVTVLTGVLLLLAALALRAPVGPGTFAVPALFGASVALLDPVVPTIAGSSAMSWLARLVILVLATHLMMLGAVLIVRASYGAGALDSVMLGAARKLRRDPAHVRIGLEVSIAVTGCVLGGVAGLGTVVAGVMVGHSFKHWARVLGVGEVQQRPAPEPRRPRRSRPSRAFRPSLSMQSPRLDSGPAQAASTADCTNPRSLHVLEEAVPRAQRPAGTARRSLQRQRRRRLERRQLVGE